MTINGTTCSRGPNSRLPFALNVTLIKSLYFFLYRSQLCYLREGASKVASKGLFTRREGYTFAKVTLASGFKLALIYKQISQVGLPGSTLQALLTCFVMRVILCNGPKFETILKFSMENTLNSRKKGKILSSQTEHNFLFFRCL